MAVATCGAGAYVLTASDRTCRRGLICGSSSVSRPSSASAPKTANLVRGQIGKCPPTKSLRSAYDDPFCFVINASFVIALARLSGGLEATLPDIQLLMTCLRTKTCAARFAAALCASVNPYKHMTT